MPETNERRSFWIQAALLVATATVYLGLPSVTAQYVRAEASGDGRPWRAHFPALAQAFLQGRFDFEAPADDRAHSELIPADEPGRFYCPYPPLPAVLLLPYVALFGPTINVATVCRLLSIINVLLFDVAASRLHRLLQRPPWPVSTRIGFVLLFAFGTAVWHNADMGGDWHLAHAAALCAMLLALIERVGRNRSWLLGGCIACAVMARPTAGLTCLFFAAPFLLPSRFRDLARLAAAPIAAAALLGWYNAARFGDAFDFGYERMLLRGEGLASMQAFGQFSLRYVPRNVFWFFLAPPWPKPGAGFPWFGYDPRGLSLVIATPAALYALAALRQIRQSASVRAAAVSIAVCLAPLLMYFNSGFWQFGHRFSMDYLPMLMILIAAGIGPRLSRWGCGLIAASIAIQTWGVLCLWSSPLRLPWL